MLATGQTNSSSPCCEGRARGDCKTATGLWCRHKCSGQGNSSRVDKHWLSQFQLCVLIKIQVDFSPLFCALCNKLYSMTALLLKRGADPDYRNTVRHHLQFYLGVTMLYQIWYYLYNPSMFYCLGGSYAIDRSFSHKRSSVGCFVVEVRCRPKHRNFRGRQRLDQKIVEMQVNISMTFSVLLGEGRV